MLGLGVIEEKPQASALFIIEDVRKSDHRRMTVPNTLFAQNSALTIFVVLLVLYLLIVVVVAIRGQIAKGEFKPKKSSGRLDETGKSTPKFIFSGFQEDQRF